MGRAYLPAMRAAEMAAWELTGGDYLRSCFVTQAATAGAPVSGKKIKRAVEFRRCQTTIWEQQTNEWCKL